MVYSEEMGHTTLDSIKSLFSDAWDLYQKRAAEFAEILLAPVALIVASDILRVQGFPFKDIAMVLGIAGWILFIIAWPGLIHSIDRKTNIDESYSVGATLFFPLIWLIILMAVTTLGGMVMLIIPGIFLSISLVFSQYMLVLEGRRGSDALSQSREYIKGYWWAVFGRVLLLGIVTFALYVIVSIPFSGLFGITGSRVISDILLLIIVPFSASYYYIIYKNLKILKPELHSHHEVPHNTFITVAQVVGIVVLVVIALAIILALQAHGFQ